MNADVEALLREALTPVEPPATLASSIEATLASWTELAQDELEGWELAAMRDPRNWVRPAAALAVTATAGTTLVLLRVRARHRSRTDRSNTLREFAQRTMHDLAEETRRVLPDR